MSRRTKVVVLVVGAAAALATAYAVRDPDVDVVADSVETELRMPISDPVLEPDRPDLIGEPRMGELTDPETDQ